MEFSDFVYSHKELKGITQKVSVNKLGSDDKARNEGIRNHYLGAFAGGGGEIYLNGKIIGELKPGQLWTYSTNLQKGDVLLVKAKAADKAENSGVGLTSLFKGRLAFNSADCELKSELVTETSLSEKPQKGNLKNSSGNSAGQKVMAKDPLKFFKSKAIWVQNAKTVWLKYVLK